MSEKQALGIAPLAIFPVALVFIVARSLLAGDLRELFAAPFSAVMITAIGYPIAFAASWLLLRTFPRLAHTSLWIAIGIGIASAEASFWLFVHPFWQREFSNLFCAALVAACGVATAAALHTLRRRTASH